MKEDAENIKDEPTVSVIIPFLDRERFLGEAIDSVLAQTHKNWELILINDGSNDNSVNIAHDFIHKYPNRIYLYSHENEANRGASSSRNLGIKHAQGDLITFLDSDDVFLPKTLEIEIRAFAGNPDADVVCGTLEYWFSWSEQIDKRERDFLVNLGLPTETLYQPPSLLVHNLQAGGRKPGIGCVILKSGFAKKVGLFEDDFTYIGEDQVFWAKVCLHAKIYVLKDCMAKYRQHSHSTIETLKNSDDANANWEKFSVWLENYLVANTIEHKQVWEALKVLQKENSYRIKYEKLLNLYHRVFPYRYRYRIRDLIIRWRLRK